MKDVVVEGQSWTGSVHAGWSEKQFVDLYSNDDHKHIYDFMKPDAKKAALSLAWRQMQPPAKEKKA